MNNNLKQFILFCAFGLMTNSIGYLAYLIMTNRNIGPKTSMSILYVAGIFIGFFSHRKWIFENNGDTIIPFIKYIIAHALGYIMSFSMLYFFSDKLLFPHQIIQAISIVVVAIYLFFAFKFFCFYEKPKPGNDIN